MNKKVAIELNGVANLTILIEDIYGYREGSETHENGYLKAKEQLILLERYMLAFTDAINKQEQPPYWHEVRENPSKYPRNRDR
jgi:hypothetical protein